MNDHPHPMLADAVVRLTDMAARLNQPSGPPFAVLAQMAGVAQQLTEITAAEFLVAGLIAASLARVLKRPLHDHPRFIELIDIHTAALNHVVKNDVRDHDSPHARALLQKIEAAVGRIMPNDDQR